MNLQNRLAQILEALNLPLPQPTQTALIEYLTLLSRWNAVYNLTAIRDPLSAMDRHIADSLAIAPFLAPFEGRWLDVGSGAGLPGIPLALIFPDRHWTLLDSNGKKTRFLVQVKASLGLKNVEVIQARVEAINTNPSPQRGEDGRRPGEGQWHPCFANIITRAFAPLPTIIAKTQHLLCENSRIWAMKGVYPGSRNWRRSSSRSRCFGWRCRGWKRRDVWFVFPLGENVE